VLQRRAGHFATRVAVTTALARGFLGGFAGTITTPATGAVVAVARGTFAGATLVFVAGSYPGVVRASAWRVALLGVVCIVCGFVDIFLRCY
jgi:hypothetical protein